MDQLIVKLRQAGLQKRLFPAKDLTSHKKAFVPEIRKLVLHYDYPRLGAGGDSKGMVEFIQNRLPAIAQSRPYAEFAVQRRPNSPPELIAHYMNGSIKRHICYKLSMQEVERHAQYLCNTSATKPPKPALTGEEVVEVSSEPKEYVRKRKNPRGSAKEAEIDFKTADHAEWKHRYWRSVRKHEWKTVGQPSDRKYPTPVLRGGETSPSPVWNPFTSEKTFRP
ncbi:39S ribosomal protein L51, mitochondrial [Chytridiales sp. JEL 0842]|nr:39S ribosomal protein L51, mitochondrial [Chytridiales sp. JEL 0842]